MFAREPTTAPGREQKANVTVITKPEGKCNVPPVPKIADISSEKRPLEILRRVNTEEIAQGDGEGAIAGEIEEQVQAVGIHVADERAKMSAACRGLQPVLLDQGGDNEFVKKTAEEPVHGRIKIDKEISATALPSPLGDKAPIAIDWSGRGGWEKEEEH